MRLRSGKVFPKISCQSTDNPTSNLQNNSQNAAEQSVGSTGGNVIILTPVRMTAPLVSLTPSSSTPVQGEIPPQPVSLPFNSTVIRPTLGDRMMYILNPETYTLSLTQQSKVSLTKNPLRNPTFNKHTSKISTTYNTCHRTLTFT